MLEGVLGQIVRAMLQGETVVKDDLIALVYERIEREVGPEMTEQIFELMAEAYEHGFDRDHSDSERTDGGRLLGIHPMEHNPHEERAEDIPTGGEGERGSEDRLGLCEDRVVDHRKDHSDPKGT